MKNILFLYSIILLACSSCDRNTSSKTQPKTKNINKPELSYTRSSCIGHKNIPLSEKQENLQGKAGFSGLTDNNNEIGEEFDNRVLLYFKKGQQSFYVLLNDEINDDELVKVAKKHRINLIIVTDLKIAAIFDVPILHLPQGGWEIKHDYLFLIKEANIVKVYKDICEEEIISLLKSDQID